MFDHAPGAMSGFDNPNSNANVDTILDFTSGEDTIELAGSIFTLLSEGTLDPDAFILVTEAQDADERIIYDPDPGNLFTTPMVQAEQTRCCSPYSTATRRSLRPTSPSARPNPKPLNRNTDRSPQLQGRPVFI